MSLKEETERDTQGCACTEQVSDSQEERICQKPMMTVPCSLISSLQIVTKQILCCLSHPVCDTFLLTALKDQYSPPDELWFRDSNIIPSPSHISPLLVPYHALHPRHTDFVRIAITGVYDNCRQEGTSSLNGDPL